MRRCALRKVVTIETATRYARYLQVKSDVEQFRMMMEEALNSGCQTVLEAARKAAAG